MEDTPLCLHAGCGAQEVLTAVGWLTAVRRAPFPARVLPLNSRKTELLFATLDESEGYQDHISHHGYAISAKRFHWQTQNNAGPDTSGGRHCLGKVLARLLAPRSRSTAMRACMDACNKPGREGPLASASEHVFGLFGPAWWQEGGA